MALISQRLTVVLTCFGQDKAGQEIFDYVYLFPKVRSNSEIQIRFLSWKDIFPASVDAAESLLVMMTSEKETHTIYTCLTVSNYNKKNQQKMFLKSGIGPYVTLATLNGHHLTERTPETVGALIVRSLYAVCKKRDV